MPPSLRLFVSLSFRLFVSSSLLQSDDIIDAERMDAAGGRAGRRLVLEHVSELQGVHVVDLKRCARKKMILLQEESLARLQAVIEFHAKIGCPTRVRDGISHLRIKAQDMRPCPW